MADMTGEEIRRRANQVTTESLESTRRMLELAEESSEMGTKTIIMLNEQGEQLRHVEQGMEEINQGMRRAEKNLTDLSKFCGLFVCPWKRVSSIENKRQYKHIWGNGGESARAREGEGGVDSSHHNRQATTASGPYIRRITNDAREDEMEENLDRVGGIIGNLKNLAVDMGNELDRQNKSLDRINNKADMNKARIDEAKKRANKLRQRRDLD